MFSIHQHLINAQNRILTQTALKKNNTVWTQAIQVFAAVVNVMVELERNWRTWRLTTNITTGRGTCLAQEQQGALGPDLSGLRGKDMAEVQGKEPKHSACC